MDLPTNTEPSAVAPGAGSNFVGLQVYPPSLKRRDMSICPSRSTLTPGSGATALGSVTRPFLIQTDPLPGAALTRCPGHAMVSWALRALPHLDRPESYVIPNSGAANQVQLPHTIQAGILREMKA